MQRLCFLLFLFPVALQAQTNIGINTDMPLFKLDIRSLNDVTDAPDLQLATPSQNHFLRLFGGRDGDPRPFVLFHESDTFRIATSTTLFGNFTERLTIQGDGHVGIGTTAPETLLHLNDSARTTLKLTATDYLDTTEIVLANGLLNSSHTHFMIRNTFDHLHFSVRSDLAGPFDNEFLTFTPLGQAGLGTAFPQAHLHIFAPGSGGQFPMLRLTANQDPTTTVRFDNTTFYGTSWDIESFAHFNDSLSTMNFLYSNGPNGGTRLTILGMGNVGIGTSIPEYKLDVNGSFRASDLAGAGDRNVIVGADGDFKTGPIVGTDTDWEETPTAVYNLTKNVGIGLATPVSNLHINGMYSTAGNASIKVRNVGGVFPLETTDVLLIDAVSFNTTSTIGSPFEIQSTSIRDLTLVRGGGHVGIGTTAPSLTKVNIAGSAITSLDVTTTPSPSVLTISSDESMGAQQLIMDGNELNTIDGMLSLNARSPQHVGIAFGGGDVFIASGGGDVSIGSSTIATGYKLSVDGGIISEEVRVEYSEGWPDYVFDAGYSLMSLEDIEQFIESDKHLPGIAPAAVVHQEGIDLGSMQAQVLEKVEELTLHLIQLNKRVIALEKENQLLKSQIQSH